MCGIAGSFAPNGQLAHSVDRYQRIFDEFLKHRGPDGQGVWKNDQNSTVLTHYRLAIIDPGQSAAQPMRDSYGHVVTFNGEIYNYQELRRESEQKGYKFVTKSDTETLLALYRDLGDTMLGKLRGMFAFALWDDNKNRLLLARDRIGIKPLYYCIVNQQILFASEIKALLPFLPAIETNLSALGEYLTFQFTLGAQTLFDGVFEIPPGHFLTVDRSGPSLRRYWDVSYEVEFNQPIQYFESKLRSLLEDSIDMHLRSDVEVASYVSGGIDSSLIHILATQRSGRKLKSFHGRFLGTPGYDESEYARAVVGATGGHLLIRDINPNDFVENLSKVIYFLDQPVAGPGSFPQFMVSELAARHVKVVLGGQGGDEIFGGYARYLVAYLEQCIKAAIDGTYKDGNYVVTLESIIPNLGVLREYKPLIQEFWRDGLFGPLDQRFLRLVDRSHDLRDEIDWMTLDSRSVYESFFSIFNSQANVKKEAYFDRMTHFEFKTLLPALLHVEDRMSMAHGLESRVPLLDHPLVEFMATVPADVKFKNGNLKHLIRSTFQSEIPASVLNRRDKMGFPVPLSEWFSGELNDFFMDLVQSMENKSRPGFNTKAIRDNFMKTARFSRKTWALISLELWHQQFHDNAGKLRKLVEV